MKPRKTAEEIEALVDGIVKRLLGTYDKKRNPLILVTSTDTKFEMISRVASKGKCQMAMRVTSWKEFLGTVLLFHNCCHDLDNVRVEFASYAEVEGRAFEQGMVYSSRHTEEVGKATGQWAFRKESVS